MKNIVIDLVKKHGMKKILNTLIQIISELNLGKEPYLNLLEKDLTNALNNYERRYERKD